eukprot:3094334-Pleurochrysis_carterae.AAC.1
MLPTTLLYICDRLADFSMNIFKIQPNGSSTATANQIITFDLPSISIIHTRLFRVYYKAVLTGTTACLPADVHSLIERVEVSAGGVILSQGLTFVTRFIWQRRLCAVMQPVRNPLAHNEIVRAKSYFDGATITRTSPESPSGFMCWNQWDSTFLES